MAVRLAVDVGGTFTDVVMLDEESGEVEILKVSSTPTAPERGFLEGVARMLSYSGRAGGEVSSLTHVGTIGTNLFLGQLGLEKPRVALLTTRGFRDVIEIGRQNRPALYDLSFERRPPLIERRFRYEVTERTSADGEVLTAPSEEEVMGLIDEMRRWGFASVAVAFLNSYANPSNEEAVKRMVEEGLGIPVYASHRVDPEHREYERFSTTIVNAVLAPVISKYLEHVSRGLRDLGIGAPLYIMSSSGGTVDVEEAKERPIVAIESGPAAGVIGAAVFAERLGMDRVISLDMGGTTAKAGAVMGYSPMLVQEIEVGGAVHMGRQIKGSGYPVRYPSIDLAEVSAGGGTIIWVDDAGAVRAGPISAGADPGPACYGRGGGEPTITDANLLLGRLGEALLGGEMRLEVGLARSAMDRLSKRAGLSIEETAWLALRVANLNMARAVKIVSLERGLDPRGFTLMAFGGAGPMHAAELAELLEIRRVVVPPFAEVFSSLGLLLTDQRYGYVSGIVKLLDEVTPSMLEERYRALERDALSQLRKRHIDTSRAVVARSMDLRYRGQGYELEVPARAPVTREEVEEIAARFEERHRAVYGFIHEGERVEVVALRLMITVGLRRPLLRSMGKGMTARGTRRTYFGGEFVDTAVYTVDGPERNNSVEGPAVIETYGTTVIIPPSWRAAMHESGCIILER